MSDVQFEEENLSVGRFVPPAQNTPVLVNLILKTGIVKTESGANYFLIAIAVLAVVLTVYILATSLGGTGGVNQGTFPAVAFR